MPNEVGSTTHVAGLLAVIGLVGGCLTPADLSPLPYDASEVSAWVLDHGWHTAIAVRRSDVDQTVWPEVGDFPEATFVEVAWGDREFYRAKPATPWLAIKAAFFASGSVLHIVGFSVPIAAYFAQREVVELRLSRRGFDAMTRFVHEEHQRDLDGRAVRLERGLYGTSWFYAARSRYHLFHTCNTWVARALHAAGLAVTAPGTLTAGGVMRQVRPTAAPR